MRPILFILTGLVMSFVTNAQEISMVIANSSNNEAIGYASVGLLGTSFGSMSNDKGEVFLTYYTPNDSLAISHVSYQSKIISVEQTLEMDTIFLDDIAIEIEEVTIRGDAGISILVAVINNLDKNHKRNDVLYKIYYHNIDKREGYYQKLDVLAETVVGGGGQFHFGVRKQRVTNNSPKNEDIFSPARPILLKFAFKEIHDIFRNGASYSDINFLRKRNIKKFNVNVRRKYIDKVKGPIVELDIINLKSQNRHLLVVNQDDYGIYNLEYDNGIRYYFNKIDEIYYLRQIDWSLGRGMTRLYMYDIQQGVKGMYFEKNFKNGIEIADNFELENDEDIWAPFRHLIK